MTYGYFEERYEYNDRCTQDAVFEMVKTWGTIEQDEVVDKLSDFSLYEIEDAINELERRYKITNTKGLLALHPEEIEE
jgi:hypothetical protein